MKHIKIFENFLNESFEQGEKIKEFVSKNSYFDFDEEWGDEMIFSTRRNGNVGDETHGEADHREGLKLKKSLELAFPSISAKVEPQDEWVILTVSMKKDPTNEFTYTFKKDNKGSGFSESFKTMDDLIKKYGDWVSVDWDDIKDKVEKINEFPDDLFTGKHASRPLQIAKIGDPGNRWGYNFYIIKTKKE